MHSPFKYILNWVRVEIGWKSNQNTSHTWCCVWIHGKLFTVFHVHFVLTGRKHMYFYCVYSVVWCYVYWVDVTHGNTTCLVAMLWTDITESVDLQKYNISIKALRFAHSVWKIQQLRMSWDTYSTRLRLMLYLSLDTRPHAIFSSVFIYIKAFYLT